MATSGSAGQTVEADRALLSATNDQQAASNPPRTGLIPKWLRRLFCRHEWVSIYTHDDHNWHRCGRCETMEDWSTEHQGCQ